MIALPTLLVNQSYLGGVCRGMPEEPWLNNLSYFVRPHKPSVRGRSTPWQIQWGRHDGLREYANLYNPFWQTTLEPSDQTVLPLLIAAGVL